MAESILPTAKGICFVCKAVYPTQEHHIFQGANRSAADRFGLWVNLCPVCHRRAHEHPKEFEKKYHLKQIAQLAAMREYKWTTEQFRELFRKSYI